MGDDGYEYRTTEGPRKNWDGTPDLTSEGWEKVSFERYDSHEEITWRRQIFKDVDGRIVAELQAQLAERNAKLDAIRSIVLHWIDNEQAKSADSMLEILEVVYRKPPVTAESEVGDE